MNVIWILLALAAAFVALSLGWRWASRRWSLPCPSFLAWTLESPFFQRFNGTRIILDRLGLRPGDKVLEIGPGPGHRRPVLVASGRRVRVPPPACSLATVHSRPR